MRWGLLVLLLAGCATAYQPRGYAGGYTDLLLGNDMARVTFEGNGYTRSDRVADFLLLRAAELTLTTGATHFVLVDRDREASTGIANFGSGPVLVTKHRREATIRFLRESAPGAMDARLIRRQLRQRYGLE